MAAPHRAARPCRPLWCGAETNREEWVVHVPLPYCVYVLHSIGDGRFYIGFTRDLQSRLVAHRDGSVASTAPRRPLRLLYCEFHGDQSAALRRERYLKTSAGHRALRLMLRIPPDPA